jgi:hypothetical protein
MLLTYTNDLMEVDRTEYLVLEMTSVISIDSTAVHVIEDIVNDFRARGVQVAFAMVGNRVEKTLRKAGLKKVIGQQWFFPTVNDAVHYCLRHQNARHKKHPSLQGPSFGLHALEVGGSPIRVGNEIGFSNELNHGFTTVFVSLVKDYPDIVDGIRATLRNNNISVERTEVEPLNENGAKHTYLVKSVKRKTKLNDLEIERLREDLLEVVMSRTKQTTCIADLRVKGKSPSQISRQESLGSSAASRMISETQSEKGEEDLECQDARLQAIEETLMKEQDSNRKIQDQLQDQWRRLDALLEIHGAAATESTVGRKSIGDDCEEY